MSEIILPERELTRLNPEQMLNEMIERKLQEILADKEAAGLYPLFPGNGKLITDALKRLQTVPEQERGSRYYEKYGCRICGDREHGHMSLGLCQKCYHREFQRDRAIRAEFARPPEVDPARLPADRISLAKAALPGPLPEPEYIAGLPGFIDLRATARKALRRRKPRFVTPQIRIKGGKNLPITPDLVQRLITAADTPLSRAIITLVYSTGCFLSELMTLRIEDITLGQPPTIRIPESRSEERIAPLNQQAFEALRQFLGDRKTGLIFEAPRTHRAWGDGSIQKRRSGNSLCWFFIWHERVENETRKADYRTRVTILGYTPDPPFKPRVFQARNRWAMSWREPQPTGKGKAYTKWLGPIETMTREQAEVERDRIWAERIAHVPRTKWDTLTKEQAIAAADRFVTENLHRVHREPMPTSIPDRVMAVIVKAVAQRAGLGEINPHMLRRAFNPNSPTSGTER